MATFRGDATINMNGTLTAVPNLGNASQTLKESLKLAFTNGTGANQASQMFVDDRAVGAGANDDLDLSGTLVNELGETVTFTSVKALVILPAAANGSNLVIGNAGSNDFSTLFGAATHTTNVAPGGFVAWADPAADGYAVTAGTGDILRINNPDGAGANYKIIIFGEE